MNKSKFLKKSLAALLAILMVVAMIPLSAAADEAEPPAETTPMPESFGSLIFWVNDTEAAVNADNTAYTVRITDSVRARISWNSVPGFTVKALTNKGTEVDLNQDTAIDLIRDANEENGVYTLHLKITQGSGDDKVEMTVPLYITVGSTTSRTDDTIKTLHVTNGGPDDTFKAIDFDINDDTRTIHIVTPLGVSAEDFMGVIDTYLATANGQAKNIFVPSLSNASVAYEETRTGAKVTVTPPSGNAGSYDVTFSQENALTDVAVKIGTTTYGPVSEFTLDGTGTKTYAIPVPENVLDNNGTKSVAGHIEFKHGENVVRVEDPRTGANTTDAGADASHNGTPNEWEIGGSNSQDEPIASGKNTFTFTGTSGYAAYLSVKTKANYDYADDNFPFYKDVKIVLVPEKAASANPVMTEFQLNGYEAVWSKDGKGLPTEFTVYVDQDYPLNAQTEGANSVGSRFSAKFNGNVEVEVLGQPNATKLENTNEVKKPNGSAGPVDDKWIGNAQIKLGQALRIRVKADDEHYTDYAITIQKAVTKTTRIKDVYLWDDTTHELYAKSIADGPNGFKIQLPAGGDLISASSKLLIVETEAGVVVTPGHDGKKNTGKLTTEAGKSVWGAGPYGVTANDKYEEHWNGVTTLGEYWNIDKYLLDGATGQKPGAAGGTADIEDILVLTTAYGDAYNNVTTTKYATDVYTVKLALPETTADTTKASLTIGSATTGLDDDVLHAGNTIFGYDDLDDTTDRHDDHGGNFNPKANVTRAQGAKMLVQVYEKYPPVEEDPTPDPDPEPTPDPDENPDETPDENPDETPDEGGEATE